MELLTGATFNNLEEINHLEVLNSSTSPVFAVGSAKQLVLRDVTVSSSPGAAPLITSSSNIDLVLDRSRLIGSEAIVDVLLGTATIWVENQSFISTGVVTSALASSVDFNCVDPNVNILAQAGISGATTVTNLSEADKIFYDNASSGLASDDVQGLLTK